MRASSCNCAGCSPADRRSNAPGERAVPDRRDDGRGEGWALVDDLVSDRAVRLVLERLGSVFEKPKSLLARVGAGRILGFVKVTSDRAHVSSQALEQPELARVRRGWHEYDCLRAEALAGPRDGGAVVPGRGGNDRGMTFSHELRDDGKRASPLEDSELVDVLPL